MGSRVKAAEASATSASRAESSRISRRSAALVAITCGLIALVDGYDMQSMSLVVSAIARDWDKSASSFGYVLSASAIGVAIGNFMLAPLGDRWGRKKAILLAILIIGLGAFGLTAASSMDVLFAWRLLVGVGFGACYPVLVATVVDFAPPKRRALYLAIISVSLSIGASGAGFLAPAVLSSFGWRGVFLIGAAATPVVALLASLILRDQPPVCRAKTQRRAVHAGIKALFSSGYRSRTLLLWVMWPTFIFVFYFIQAWMPTMLERAGAAETAALRGASMVYLGATVGHLGVAWFYDRYLNVLPLAFTAIGAIIMMLSMWWFGPLVRPYYPVMLFVIGIGLGGLQVMQAPLTAKFYPPEILSTGMGWAMGVGRAGSIFGPIVGGWGLQAGISAVDLLMWLTLPFALATMLMGWLVVIPGYQTRAGAA